MLKRFLFLSLVCCSLLSLSACSILPQASTEESTEKKKKKKKHKKENPESTEESDDEDDDEDDKAIDTGNFEFLDFDISREFVNSAQSDTTYSKLSLKSSGYENLAQAVDKLNAKVKTSYENNGKKDSIYHDNNYFISRADNKVLSIFSSEEVYDEYSTWYLSSATYDSQTGEEISLSDIMKLDFDFDKVYSDFELDSLIKDPSEFKSRIKSFIADEAAGKNNYKSDQTIAWALGYNGISIYTPVEMADSGYYYTRLMQFDIPYSKYPELYTKKYMSEPDEFGFNIATNGEFYYDINKDGKPEHIRLSANTDPQNYGINEYVIDIDGNVTKIAAKEISGYSIDDFVFVKTNNKNYLMFNETGDNDGKIIRVIDLNKLDFAANTEFDPYPSFYNYAYNPKKMPLLSTIYTVSTLQVSNIYEFTSDEKFKVLNNTYKIESNFTFTSKVDLQVDVISENKEVVESTVIPSGTKFYPYETDSASYTDYLLLDGRIVRLPMSYNAELGYGYTINGMPVGDVFDGVLYAG